MRINTSKYQLNQSLITHTLISSLETTSKYNGYNATTEKGSNGKNIRLLWRLLANNIKFLCFTTCV